MEQLSAVIVLMAHLFLLTWWFPFMFMIFEIFEANGHSFADWAAEQEKEQEELLEQFEKRWEKWCKGE